jgi:hypothetical protein
MNGNPTTGLFQTLVAAASDAAESLQYKNAFVDAIYWEHKPTVATPAQTLNVIIPTVDEADVTDIGSGPINVTATDHNSVSILFDKHFSTSFVIKAWDQARTPEDLKRKYLAPRFEALLRKVNRTIASVCNTTNFGTSATPVAGYALASGASTSYFTRVDINQCWTNLVNAGVPTDDEANMFFITGPTSYGKMLTDQTMSYQYIVSDNAAREAQQKASLSMILGARPVYDQHFEADRAALGFTHYPGVLMHRYAIAAVTAQPAPLDPSGSFVQESIVWLKNKLPVQLQMVPSVEQGGTIVHLHCYWGVKAARADFASLIDSA